MKRNESRERILDAFEDVLISDGERSATVEHVAERAGVTRGALVYHFASKEEMIDAFIERLGRAGNEASAQLIAAPEGAVERYILSAAPPMSALDKTLLAATRLAYSTRPAVVELLQELHRQWVRVLTHVTGDAALARLVLLVGDGVLFHSVLTGEPFALGDPEHGSPSTERRELMELIGELVAMRCGDRGEAGVLG